MATRNTKENLVTELPQLMCAILMLQIHVFQDHFNIARSLISNNVRTTSAHKPHFVFFSVRKRNVNVTPNLQDVHSQTNAVYIYYMTVFKKTQLYTIHVQYIVLGSSQTGFGTTA